MRQRRFGSTGRNVPVIGQGTWKLRDAARAEGALRRGLDLGLTHIDTAQLYRGSEEVVGRAIRGRRDDVFLVSKVLPSNASYQGTLEACDRSLAKLGTEYLDVYLLHWESATHPLEDTMRALGELVDDGKIRHAGVSNFGVAELDEARSHLGPHTLACDQVYYSMEARNIEHELLPYCKGHGIALVGYSPFGSGNFPSERSPAGKVLRTVATQAGLTAHQAVLQFLARDEDVFLIPKAEDKDHVEANASALDTPLSASDLARLDDAFPLGNSTEIPYL